MSTTDWKCPVCKKRAAKTKASIVIAKINGEHVEALVCRKCQLHGHDARPLATRGELASRQRSKMV